MVAASRFMLGTSGRILETSTRSGRRLAAARNSQNPHPFRRNGGKDGAPKDFRKMHGLDNLPPMRKTQLVVEVGASTSAFQLPSACLPHTTTYLALVVSGLPFLSLKVIS
jgi:hypothetical protein